MLRSIGFFIALSLAGLVRAVEVKPEINGTYEDACRLTANTASRCAVGGPDSSGGSPVPSSIYGHLLGTAKQMSYITLRDITVTRSPGLGIRIEDNNDHIIVDNMESSLAASLAIDIRPDTVQYHVKNNSFHDTSICYWHYRGKYDASLTNITSVCNGFGPAVAELGGLGGSNPIYGIFENNDAYNDYIGEIVGIYDTRGSVWVIGNRVRNARRNGIYLDNTARNLIEMNISWNTTSPNWASLVGVDRYGNSYPDYDVRGFDVAHEGNRTLRADGGGDNIFRNNISGGNNDCLFMAGVFNSVVSTGDNEGSVGASYYHNTCVGYTGKGVEADNGAFGTAYNEHFDLVNNLFYSDVDSDDCDVDPSSAFAEGTVIGPNYWEATPTDVDCRTDNGSYPDVIGNANLARNRDTWNEADWTDAVGPTAANAVLQAGDSGLNAGRPLQTAISWLDGANFDYFSDVTTCSFTEAEWEKQAAYDINCNLRSATTPNLGADETN